MDQAVLNVLGALRFSSSKVPNPTCNCAKALAVSATMLKSVLPSIVETVESSVWAGTLLTSKHATAPKVQPGEQATGTSMDVAMGPVLDMLVHSQAQPVPSKSATPSKQGTVTSSASHISTSEGRQMQDMGPVMGMADAYDVVRMRSILQLNEP